MNIFQEVTESRMIRQVAQLHGTTQQELCEKLFEHLLALQVLAIDNPGKASEYANQIISAINFAGFRQSQPDLYNLIVFLIRPGQFTDQLDTEHTVIIPEFQLKRVLRAVAAKDIDIDDYNQLMMVLQRRLPGINSGLINLRREISDYKRLTDGEKSQCIRRLLLQMRERQVNSDLYQELDKLYRTTS
jgi:hypothetical protein